MIPEMLNLNVTNPCKPRASGDDPPVPDPDLEWEK